MQKMMLNLAVIFSLAGLSACATTNTTNANGGDAFASYHSQPQQSNAMENANKMISY